MKVLFVHPYPTGAAPSQRFRFEQYIPFLIERGVEVHIAPFWDQESWNVLYSKGYIFNKAWALFKGWYKRWNIIKKADEYDYVFIHRELDPIGISFLRKPLKNLTKAKVIFDLDDAIWIPNSSSSNKMFERFKNWIQASQLASLAYCISGGNSYLCEWGQKYSPQSKCIPTTVDTLYGHNKIQSHKNSKVVFGWTGTHSTLKYLNPMLPTIERILNKYDNVEFCVICDSQPEFSFPKMKWIPWNKEREIEDLLNLHIGLMPLEEDLWAKGKCGFKAIQYMALGIPALVSPVGVNVEIVDDQVNGFICKNEEDWEKYLQLLIENPTLREEMGAKARPKIEQNYSIESVKSDWLSLFQLT